MFFFEKEETKERKENLIGLLGTLAAILLGKLKYLLVIFKVLKLQTLLSLFISLGSYALFFGWKFALALVYLLFVHEMGHAYAAKRIKLPVSPAIFIPFMGAVIGMKEMPKSAKEEGYVAYMGPLFGLLSFLPAIPLYWYTHDPFWALLIILGGMINLFNLVPITPLDGGRIAAGISTKLWGLGIILLLTYSVINLSFIGFLIVILGSREWYKLYKKQKSLHNDKLEIQKLEQALLRLKQESHDLDLIDQTTRNVKSKISNQEIINILNRLSTVIGKMKKDLYLQQLSGTYSMSEEDSYDHQHLIKPILDDFESKLAEYKLEVKTTETYYKTDKKTKVQLFLIYIGLVVALSFSYYYGNEILLNHPEIQKAMSR